MLSLHRTALAMDVDASHIAFQWARKVWHEFSTRRRQRKAVAQLHALSDRSLADIGISRSEINSIVLTGGRDASRRAR